MSENTTSHAGAAMNCDHVSQNDLAEKYLQGQLSEADQEAYELHYFHCTRCFEDLQAHQILQTELKRSAAAIRAEDLPKHAVWRWTWAPVAAIAVVIVSVGVWKGWLQHGGNARLQVAVQTTQQAPNALPSLSLLAAVEPPAYQILTLRGNGDEATQKFELAMQRYLKRDYAGAIRGLRMSLKLNPDAADARFYLGVSYLLTGQTEPAIAALRRTTSMGDSPYVESAHFYLAKAFIIRNDLAPAAEELDKTIAFRGSHEAEARRLIEQLQILRKTQP